MSEAVILALIGILGSAVTTLSTIIPAIISNRKKTQEMMKEQFVDVDKKIKEIKNDVRSVNEKLEQHIEENEKETNTSRDERAVTWRVRILRGYDDLCNKNFPYPSEGTFMQLDEDCGKYKEYIKSTPGFHNGIGEEAMDYIQEMYHYCKLNNLFGKMKYEKP